MFYFDLQRFPLKKIFQFSLYYMHVFYDSTNLN
jgi:hypothetical protein